MENYHSRKIKYRHWWNLSFLRARRTKKKEILICYQTKTSREYLSDSFSKYGSKGKNISNLSTPPNAFEKSDSSKLSENRETDFLHKLAAFACLRNSWTIEGKQTCSWAKELKLRAYFGHLFWEYYHVKIIKAKLKQWWKRQRNDIFLVPSVEEQKASKITSTAIRRGTWQDYMSSSA